MDNAVRRGGAYSGAAPAVTGGKFYPIVRAKPVAKVQGFAVNPLVHGVWCHYFDGRTEPCLKGAGQECGACGANKRRWYGYLPILSPTEGKIQLAEITAEAAVSCLALKDDGADLRGRWLTLERLGLSKRSRVRLTLEERPIKGTLPQPIDTAKALERIWGVYPWHLDAAPASKERG